MPRKISPNTAGVLATARVEAKIEQPPHFTTQPRIMSATLPTPLVSTAWLADNLQNPSLRIYDASWYLPSAGRNPRDEFAAAHIPGAVYADLDALASQTAPFPHTLETPELLAQRLGALGIGDESMVVVYDNSGQHFSAPRLWWMITTLGHAQVAVLDGGLVAWQREGRETSTASTSYPSAHFTPQLDSRRWRDLDTMRATVDDATAQVVDARSLGRFSGTEAEPRAGVRGGHMPGARHVHYASLVDSDGKMLSADALRARFDSANVKLDEPITASCGTGITACAVLLALEVVGAPQTSLYDGSWTEWGSQADTPVETG